MVWSLWSHPFKGFTLQYESARLWVDGSALGDFLQYPCRLPGNAFLPFRLWSWHTPESILAVGRWAWQLAGGVTGFKKCVRACVQACVRACVRACARGGNKVLLLLSLYHLKDVEQRIQSDCEKAVNEWIQGPNAQMYGRLSLLRSTEAIGKSNNLH